MADKLTLTEAIVNRRTYYAINKELPISDDRVVELVKFAITNVPSAFNSQSARLVVLFKNEHEKFWDLVLEALRAIVPAEQFPASEQRIGGFKAGYGSILFYEDPEVIATWQKQAPMYKDKFPQWSEHTSAMHQYALWLALEAEGAGASLQHYNPIINKSAAQTFNIPEAWDLKAHLVFGGRAGGPAVAEKPVQPIDGQRLFVHGK